MKKKNYSSDRSWENQCVNVACATFISFNHFTWKKKNNQTSTSLKLTEKVIFHMYICSYMKWISFVQIIYRTLAVYQEQNEFSKKNRLVLLMTMVTWNGLQCGVSLPSKARIHSGRSERLEADGQTEEWQRKRKKGKELHPFCLAC